MTDGQPKVAVVIPTFNRWPHVGVAIDSALAQTYPHVECVVVDDGSTDGTATRLPYVFGQRIRLITLATNREKSHARNAGIRATDAEYVCMLDSDDVLTPNSVADRMRPFLEDPEFTGVAYGLSDRDAEHGDDAKLGAFAAEAVQGDVLDRYLNDPFVCNNDYLLSRQDMLTFGMYKEDLTNREDVELLIRLAARLEFRFCGSYVARVKRVDVSAQMDYEKYIRQGTCMISHLRADEFVANRMGSRLDELERRELVELARACYKSSQFVLFRSLCRRILGQCPRMAFSEWRLVRRFLFSFLRRQRQPSRTDVRARRGVPFGIRAAGLGN